MEGRVIGGYKVLSLLGQGTFGTTWKVERDGTYFALKLFKNEMIRSDMDAKRIEREITALRTLNHPNVVRYVADGIHTDGYERFRYLVMEYADGEPLRNVIARSGKLSVQQTQRIVDQLLVGLEAIHESGFLHRDLKPENIFITRLGDVRILDFGLVKLLDASNLTSTGTAMGTFAYMAPELLTDAKKADYRSDLYSVGAILFHMITGALPLDIRNIVEASYKILNVVPPFASSLNPAVPSSLDNLIANLLEKDAFRRTHTTETIRSELRNLGSNIHRSAPVDLTLRLLPRLLHNERSFIEQFQSRYGLDGVVFPANFFPKYRAVFDFLVTTGAFTLIDPVVYRLAYSKFSDTQSLVQLPYVISKVNKELPTDFETLQSCELRAQQVIDWQRSQNPSAFVAPFHYWDSVNDDWVEVDLKVFSECRRHLAAVREPRPLYAGVSIKVESLTDEKSRIRLVNAITRTQADGYVLMFDANLDNFNTAHYYAFAAVTSMLGALEKPIVLSRVNDFALGLTAFGATAISSGIGFIESFEESILIERTGPYSLMPKYYIPQLLTSFTEQGLADILEPAEARSLLCDCPFCQGRTDPKVLSSPEVTKGHYLWTKRQQISALNDMTPAERLDWFERQVISAIDLAKRLKKATKSRHLSYDHLPVWLESLRKVGEERKAAAARSFTRPS